MLWLLLEVKPYFRGLSTMIKIRYYVLSRQKMRFWWPVAQCSMHSSFLWHSLCVVIYKSRTSLGYKSCLDNILFRIIFILPKLALSKFWDKLNLSFVASFACSFYSPRHQDTPVALWIPELTPVEACPGLPAIFCKLIFRIQSVQ